MLLKKIMKICLLFKVELQVLTTVCLAIGALCENSGMKDSDAWFHCFPHAKVHQLKANVQ